MFTILNVLGILLISIVATTIPSCSGSITLTSEYSSTYVKITCSVSDPDATDFMIHLNCPFVETGVCFSNCVAPVAELTTIRCHYNNHNHSFVSTSYQIKTSQIQKAGDWSCSFKNFKSSSISLASHEVPSTTTRSRDDTVSVPIRHVTVVDKYHTYVDSSTKPSQPLYKEDQSTKSSTITNQSYFLDYMTRHELVLVLILLLGVSLLLNLSFLIRCVLLKSVIENYYRGIPNSQCILECLCLDLVSHKYIHRRYTRNMNFPNQVASTNFYTCQQQVFDNMAIYDDLSAVSNNSARMKMRSNHSSELDDETQLTNIVPNGGYHINNPLAMGSVSSSLTRRYANPSHATYFHPGLGNYVIVSGPVASHDQYSVGTAPSGYALQMVSPIPSAPGSIGGGAGTHHSASSAHSDESDNDSRTALSASMTSAATPHRSVRVNSQPIDLKDSGKMVDMSHNFVMPMNGLEHHYHHDHHRNYARTNGSVPLHPWPIDNRVPTRSSISSLPYYPVSENGACNQDLRNKNTNDKLPSPPKDASVIDP